VQVQSLTASGAYTASPPAPGGGVLRGQLGYIAGRLGVSEAELTGALRRGSSLNGLAAAGGISSETLRAEVGVRIAAERAVAGPSGVDPARLDEALTRAFAQTAGPARPGDPRAAYGAATATGVAENPTDEDPAPTTRISILA
jgi:hypothetical protein